MKEEVLVSQASMRNWERLSVNKKEFKTRMTKRANKRFSSKTIIPVEYFIEPSNLEILNNILSTKKDIKTVILSLGINYLKANHISNKFTEKILIEYGKNVTPDKYLLNINLPKNEIDFLGIVYQSLMTEGSKNQKGSYYTPTSLTKDITDKIKEDVKILDPCCGTGSFLLSVAKKIKNPQNIYGYDLDENACFIAKINLIVEFKNIEFMPQIFHKDFLLEDNLRQDFDVIATNPPWGAVTSPEYKKLYPLIASRESFSYFILKSEKFLHKNGIAYFVLPESILNVKVHKDIRQFILKNYQIVEIKNIGRAFSGVLSKVVVLTLSKQKSNENISIKINEKEYKINPKYYLKNTNNIFSIIDNFDVNLLKKIYSHSHQTLDNSSIWAIGIVTGNNKKYVSANKNLGEKIYSGKNILKYKISDSENYINYTRENFQQVAPENIYRAKEKLVYKFISKKLIFAYDNKQRLFLNSANILIPKLENYTIKDVMTFLNSTLFQYIYTKKFNELKVLKGNLTELPFPVFDKKKYKKLSDNTIFRIFNLTDDEIKYIKNEVK